MTGLKERERERLNDLAQQRRYDFEIWTKNIN
jgi:hypothetical protein